MDRRAQLADSLARLRDRLATACREARRDPAELTLVAVTKTFPASDVRLLAELGVTDVGENRDQEARDKHDACADLALRWHFVGRLQRNKVRSVASYADVVHSVDRPELVAALDQAAAANGRALTALVQVSLDPESGGGGAPGRGGAPPSEVPRLADEIAATAGLRLGGLMAVAPLGADADRAFASLAAVAAVVRDRHPDARIVSAGMSGDLEEAIRHGATHVRVGTALLGRREPQVG